MPIRFQADANLNQIIVSAVMRRVPAIDFRTAASAGLAGLKDREVLAAAADDGRVVVTLDQATMPRHFREFLRAGDGLPRFVEQEFRDFLTCGAWQVGLLDSVVTRVATIDSRPSRARVVDSAPLRRPAHG